MKPSNFQFINPYITDIYFKVNPDYTKDEFDIQNEISVHINKSNDEANIAIVELEYKINSEEGNTPFNLNITVASKFTWDNLDDKTLDIMLKNNAPALLLSYMRPIVSNITNSAGFPPYNIPFINFTE